MITWPEDLHGRSTRALKSQHSSVSLWFTLRFIMLSELSLHLHLGILSWESTTFRKASFDNFCYKFTEKKFSVETCITTQNGTRCFLNSSIQMIRILMKYAKHASIYRIHKLFWKKKFSAKFESSLPIKMEKIVRERRLWTNSSGSDLWQLIWRDRHEEQVERRPSIWRTLKNLSSFARYYS